jgi:hypothetical protein
VLLCLYLSSSPSIIFSQVFSSPDTPTALLLVLSIPFLGTANSSSS